MSEKQHTPEPGTFVKYAGSAYEVVDVVDHFGCLFVRIYDEPPSRHIDEIKLSSVELINVPNLLAKVEEQGKEIENQKLSDKSRQDTINKLNNIVSEQQREIDDLKEANAKLYSHTGEQAKELSEQSQRIQEARMIIIELMQVADEDTSETARACDKGHVFLDKTKN